MTKLESGLSLKEAKARSSVSAGFGDQDEALLKDFHMRLTRLEQPNHFGFDCLVALSFRDSGAHSILPVVFSVFVPPVSRLVPYSHIISLKARIDKHFSQCIGVRRQREVAIELLGLLVTAEVPMSLPEHLQVLSVLLPADDCEAGARTRFEHSKGLADLPLAMLHEHQGKIGDIRLKHVVFKRQAHVVRDAREDQPFVRAILGHDALQIDPLAICNISVVCLRVNDNFVARKALEVRLSVALPQLLYHALGKVARDEC